MKRKLVALLLALALFAAIPFTAAADAYIPPEPVEGFDMNYAYMENGNCKALNTFLSNFVEMGLAEFSPETYDDELFPAVLKHMELNARYYPKYVKKLTKDGDPYMQISGSHFEERMEHLFGRTVSASQCPGYEDGKIVVSADQYDGPIRGFASVYGCYPAGENLWEVYFEPFRIDTDFSGWYTTAYSNLPWDKITSLGNGYALVQYTGGKTYKSISTSDFTLIEFAMDAENIPCMGANLPYDYAEPTEAPTEAPTDAPTEAPTETIPDTPSVPDPTEAKRPSESKPVNKPEKEPEEAGIDITMVLVIILVAAVVLLALVIVIGLLTRKKPDGQGRSNDRSR